MSQTSPLVFFLGLVCLAGTPARADLLNLWRLEEGSGGTTANLVGGGVPGSIANFATGGLGPGGSAWITNDATRGTVLSFNGDDAAGAFVAAGTIPSLGLADNFSWAFLAHQDSGQAVNNDVILGNRFGGVQSPLQFTKFTANGFEWYNNGNQGIDYANVPSDNTWYHHAVVKSGTQLTYFRNGVASGMATISSPLAANPFYFGGDAGGERWRGRIDDVAQFDSALDQQGVLDAMNGNFSVGPPPPPKTKILVFSDNFNAAVIDTQKWSVQAADFEVGQGTYTADQTTRPGQLTIAGQNDIASFWGGTTLQSTQSFSSAEETEIVVDRVALSGFGSAWRSSLWIRQQGGSYLHFAQNVGENGWQFNANSTASGTNLAVLDGLDGDVGQHQMKLVYIPQGGSDAQVQIWLDDTLAAVHAFNGDWDNNLPFEVRLSGMARATDANNGAPVGHDMVDAAFDNLNVSIVTTIPEPSSFALVALGGLGLGLAAVRRRWRRSTQGR